MGMVVDDDEVSTVGEQTIDQPVRTAAIYLAAGVAFTDRALQLEAVEQSFDAPVLGVGRPYEAFDGHLPKATLRLGRNSPAERLGARDLAL